MQHVRRIGVHRVGRSEHSGDDMYRDMDGKGRHGREHLTCFYRAA